MLPYAGMIRIRFYGRGWSLSARFELPWHAGEHSHLVFIALLVQVGALTRARARTSVAEHAALRAPQQVVTIYFL